MYLPHKNQLILIVEDNKLNIKILIDMLNKYNYQIAVMNNGKDALQFIKENIPDLILLDIIMPEMDGFEVCTRLKNNEKTKDIPVMFISSLQNVENKIKGFKLGAVDYITKPFQQEEVLARVNTHLKLKMMKERLKEENKWFKTLYKNATDPIVLFDENYCIIEINDKFENVFKYSMEEIEGENINEVLKNLKEDTINRKETEAIMSGENIEVEGVINNKHGQTIDCLIKGIPVIIEEQLAGGFIMYVDITEIKEEEEKIRQLSFHDQMTGLYNRRYFENELQRLNCSRDLPIGVIIADLDGLKEINDNYGHRTGDKYIKKSADIIHSVIRGEDVAARIGGDEFAVLLPCTGGEIVKKIIKRIKNKCKKIKDQFEIPVTMSIGYAVKKKQNQELEKIFKIADKNMYKIKKKRKENYSEIKTIY